MNDPQPWLPPGTCFGSVDRRIAGIVREWSRAWFGDDEVEVAPGSTMREAAWRSAKPLHCGQGAWLIVSDDAPTAIGRCALHLEPDSAEPAADRAVFEAVGGDCLAALRDALARGLETEHSPGADIAAPASLAGPAWQISRKRSAVRLVFAMSEAERIALLRRLLPRPPRKPELVSPGLALAPFEVDLAANLGRVGVTLAELGSLAAGDVLVLDRELSGASPLAVNGAPTPGGTCTVSREDDRLLLEIAEPIIGRNT